MPEVAPTDWSLIVRLALQCALIQEQVAQSSIEQRRVDPALRAAFAKQHRDRIVAAGNHLGEACTLCGEVTCCWCEACEVATRPQAQPVCNACDRSGLVCRVCSSEGLGYPTEPAAVSGFYVQGEDGVEQFIELEEFPECKTQ